MKTSYSLALVTAFLLAPLSIAAAESVTEIIERVESEKVAALTAYLDKNPDAEDYEAGLSHLIDAYDLLGDTDKIPPLLKQRYDSMDKGPDANLADLIGNVVQPLLMSYTGSGDKEKAIAFIEVVKTDTAEHPMAGQIGQFLDQISAGLNTPSAGDTLEIAFTSTSGEEIDLAKMKEKVVLVDFWATWCGPCVAEMPSVIAAYEKHHENGFEVIGISLDSDKDALLKFIEEKKMPWPQYFDGKGWKNEIAGRYSINSIPATFLIGKDGKIAASNLRGDALETKIAELLK